MQTKRLYTYLHMPVTAQAKEVLVRLGMYRDFDELSLQRARHALQALMPGGCIRLVPLQIQQDEVIIEDRPIQSASLAAYLKGCDMALVMLSTLYQNASDAIQLAFANHRADEAVMLDAAASVAADAGLDFLMQDASRMLRPFGKTVLTRRFSPGYGDCSIEYQKTLMDILSDQPLGVTLTDSFMLQPEKSVLAIGGIKDV